MRKRVIKTPKKSILICTADALENAFFVQMRKDCRYVNMTVELLAPAKNAESLVVAAMRAKNREKANTVWLVISMKALGLQASQVKGLESFAKSKKVNLAWADPSVSLYWSLHFGVPGVGVSEDDMLASVATKVPGINASVEYLEGEGSNLHLRLFANKARAALNATTFNQAYRMKNGIDGINYTRLLNSISEFCGEADIAYNQRSIAQ